MGVGVGAAPLHSLVLTDNMSEPCVLHRLRAGLPPYSPVFKSWIHCWKYLSVQVSMLGWGSRLLGGGEEEEEQPGGTISGEGTW